MLSVKEWVDKNPFGNVIIGCDSQAHSKYIKYSVSIAMHMVDEYGIGHGAHVIFANYLDTNKALRKDVTSKLQAEAFITMEAAESAKALLESGELKIQVHLDYNSNPKYYSNNLYQNYVGMFRGMGYEAFGKPYAYVASHASDALCKNKQAKGVK